MKQPKCDRCGDTHPLEYLTIDRETKDYLCPSCYSKNKSTKEDCEITSAILFIIAVIIVIVIFCPWAGD